MADTPLMEITDVAGGIRWQADHAEKAGAPCTGRVVRAALKVIEGETVTGRRMAKWQGFSLEAAVPLRLAGGLHHLLLTGQDRRLEPAYRGQIIDQAQIDALVCDMVAQYDAQLAPWLDGPPQTNEAGRSWAFMAALMWLSHQIGCKFELNELGASAGINTMMERYFYDLGGVVAGPVASPMRIVPEWRGSPPPEQAVEITSISGCDIAPIDLSDPEQALRLKSYVWPEALGRVERIEAAIALARENPPDLVQQDAGDYVAVMLARGQEVGVARVLYHSIMWQYLPEATRAAITGAMEAAGAQATRERPLAWIALETNRETFQHELRVRYWPGGGEAVLLACGHPHGAWAQWLAD